MKSLVLALFLVACLVAIPVISQAGQCQKILSKVDSYPKDRLWELVQKAPDSCKVEVKTAIFERRGVIVDDFRRR